VAVLGDTFIFGCAVVVGEVCLEKKSETGVLSVPVTVSVADMGSNVDFSFGDVSATVVGTDDIVVVVDALVNSGNRGMFVAALCLAVVLEGPMVVSFPGLDDVVSSEKTAKSMSGSFVSSVLISYSAISSSVL
jgi:hypothetical protein